jgi:hypothetical protein
MVSIVISVLSFAVSITVAWLTLFRRGTVKMTQPTVIYFGPGADSPLPKVFLRTLLFSTAKRGRIIECIHVTLSRNETRQNFNIWVYGNDKLVRGSGLFVGETGVEANHHFLAPNDSSFRFTEGRYELVVFARLLGDKKQLHLFSQTLEISPELAVELAKPHVGLYFDWGPDSGRYLPYLDSRSPSPDPKDFLKALGIILGEHKQEAPIWAASSGQKVDESVR